SATAFFNGVIDEVALYSIALTPTQISNRAGIPPVNTSFPTVSGGAAVGQVLSGGSGTWSGTQPISFAYQWQRCDTGGANCLGINNGAYHSGTTLGQPGAIANDPDTAVAFNGTSGWLQVANDSSLNVGDRFSIEAWVKRGSIGGSANQVIASKQANSWVLMFN